MGSLVNVKLAKMVWIGLLVLVWAAASNHCKLEQIPSFAFLACCDHEDTTAPHQDDDCEGDACAVVESGFYKTEERQNALAAPSFSPVVFQSPPAPLTSAPAGALAFVHGLSPPELSRIWQFSFRTALPPRAPSLVS